MPAPGFRRRPEHAFRIDEPGPYVPRHFAIEDAREMHAAIRRIGISTLITLGDELEASLLPLVLQVPGETEFGTLRGHLAKPNP